MELSSKPKPVRIRISIGGKEHTTIDSLKENMTPEILDFIDGRLQRWLKQQNLDELSGVIDAINKEKITSGQKLLRIYNCFFGKGYKKILFFVDEWQKNIRSKSLLKYYFENKDKETLVSVSLPDTLKKYLGILSLEEWDEIISPLNHSLLNEILKSAKKKGIVETNSAIAASSDSSVALPIFDGITDDVKRKIAKGWRDGTYISLSSCRTNKNEEGVYDFIKKCSTIYSSRDTKQAVEREFAFRDYSFNYFLINEIRCVRALATLYEFSKRYDSSYLLIDKREEADVHLLHIPEDYPFKKKIKNCNERDQCLSIVGRIIHYLLLERRYLPNE
ncbi:MAG: hypothetical protein J6V04_04560 [Bacteroidales bacterium]|nr:hypothetical protein [Bacteroidales bacterium]